MSVDAPHLTASSWPWIGRNLLRLAAYLAVASLISTVTILALDRSPPPFLSLETLRATLFGSMFMFFIGGAGCLPGLAAWLVVLNRVKAWSPSQRRRAAVATAPLVGLVWLVVGISRGDLDGLIWGLVFGVFWPLGAGLVVRFPAP